MNIVFAVIVTFLSLISNSNCSYILSKDDGEVRIKNGPRVICREEFKDVKKLAIYQLELIKDESVVALVSAIRTLRVLTIGNKEESIDIGSDFFNFLRALLAVTPDLEECIIMPILLLEDSYFTKIASASFGITATAIAATPCFVFGTYLGTEILIDDNLGMICSNVTGDRASPCFLTGIFAGLSFAPIVGYYSYKMCRLLLRGDRKLNEQERKNLGFFDLNENLVLRINPSNVVRNFIDPSHRVIFM